MDLAKQQFRQLLNDARDRLGLSPAAVDELTRGAQVGRWRAGQRIFDASDTTDLVNFLVAGAVKVSCPTGEGAVCVQMVRPGQFFGLNWYSEPGQPRMFVATAFTDSIVAMLGSRHMARIIRTLSPDEVLQLFAYSWRALSGLLYEKCCLLDLDLRERLLHELGILARDFGATRADGSVALTLALTHADLAELAIASRAKVAAAMKLLERQGLVARDGRHLVLPARFFAGEHKHVDRLIRNGWVALARRVA
jgi:CRP-like cAMP-binding protein